MAPKSLKGSRKRVNGQRQQEWRCYGESERSVEILPGNVFSLEFDAHTPHWRIYFGASIHPESSFILDP